MGEEADDFLTSANASEEDRKKLETVQQKLDSFFDVHKNVIFERARFNCRNQCEGESTEEYITCLYNLVESCEYEDLKSAMIRDRLVVGIRDSSISECLQADAALTLKKAKTIINSSSHLTGTSLISNRRSTMSKRSHLGDKEEHLNGRQRRGHRNKLRQRTKGS